MDFLDINTPSPSSNDLARQLKDILSQLRANLQKAQTSYTFQANKHRIPTPPSICVGSSVFLNRKNISPKSGIKKLSQKFFGPFKIIEQINPVTFRLDLPSNLQIHPVFHVSLLEPATPDAYPNQNQNPQPILVDNDTEFEVDTILQVRGKGKRRKYLVRWKNTDESENTWEPTANLTNCQDKIKEFHDHHILSTPVQLQNQETDSNSA
jgi:Chromo (CHRromatin Organisation MOdifier) domain